jgi:hypothetical protein
MEWRYQRYLDFVERRYREAGYVSTPERREFDHLCWLAGYQCCGWSKNGISRAVRKNRAVVIRAIGRLAFAIGLRLRPAARNARGWTVEKIRAELNHKKCDARRRVTSKIEFASVESLIRACKPAPPPSPVP